MLKRVKPSRVTVIFGMSLLIPLLLSILNYIIGTSFVSEYALFLLFGVVLLSIALMHKYTFQIAIAGVIMVLMYKSINGFAIADLVHHVMGDQPFLSQILDKHNRSGEWSILLNLFMLLIGFEILAHIFRSSKVPVVIQNILPAGKTGAFLLLVLVFLTSTFLDNIAAAIIGGTIARVVFGKIHIGYLAAIVAASNAGGAGSVVGDTTTTMMWIEGVSPLNVLHAFIGAFVALLFFATMATRQQHAYAPLLRSRTAVKVNFYKLFIVFFILAGTIITNVMLDLPFVGVWIVLIFSTILAKLGLNHFSIPWKDAQHAVKGSIFLVCLIFIASVMPVDELPSPSVVSTFALGVISSVFDNIPLTKLALSQGHYDWGLLAFAVGFGGSITWFGSSAGVALTNENPEGRNVGLWVKKGWHIGVGYVIGFVVLVIIAGFHPTHTKKHAQDQSTCTDVECVKKRDNPMKE